MNQQKLNRLNAKINKKFPFAKILDYAEADEAPPEIERLILDCFDAMETEIERLAEQEPILAHARQKLGEIKSEQATEIYCTMAKRFAVGRDFTELLKFVLLMPESLQN